VLRTCDGERNRVESMLGVVTTVEPSDPWETDFDRWSVGIRPQPAGDPPLWFDERSVDLIGVVERPKGTA
jgi:hypothetical protein